MTIRYFRGRRGEFIHERDQLKEVAGIVEEEFDDEPVYLLTNIKMPRSEIDCIVLTRKGPVILDLKSYCGEIHGSLYPEEPWSVLTPEGEEVLLKKNLVDQLKTERGEFNRRFQTIRETFFDEITDKEAGRIGAWGYFRAGSTFPDGQISRWDAPWFAVVTADNLAEQLRYINNGYELYNTDLDLIVQELHLEEYDFGSERPVQAETVQTPATLSPTIPPPVVATPTEPIAHEPLPDPKPQQTLRKESTPVSPPPLPPVQLPDLPPGEPCLNRDISEEEVIQTPKPLSESQKQAVLSQKTYVKVNAGAGAGKTETLTRKIVHLLLVEKADPASIVAFTFTRKAAQNMKSRIYSRVEQLGGIEACARLGEMYVGTIHSYCLRILQDHCGYRNFNEMDEHQEMAFLMRVGRDCFTVNRGNYAKNCTQFIDSFNVVYAEMADRDALRTEAPAFALSVEKYEEQMDRYRVLSFNRMIDIAIKQIEQEPRLTAPVRYLIVDEYQDINRSQEYLIELIGKDAHIFVVGDPRQTVYQWRGSDERCFDEFGAGKDVELVSIQENRRSGPAIIDLANAIADTFNAGYDPLLPVRESEGDVWLVEHPSDLEEAIWIADRIAEMVGNGSCKYRDVAVLYRSVSNSAPVLIEALRKREIPFIIAGKVGLFDRPEIRTVARCFLWIPEDGFFEGKNYNEIYVGDELLKSAVFNWKEVVGDGVLPDTYEESVRAWREKARSGDYANLVSLYYELLDILGYKSLDPNEPLQAVVMANLGRFSTLLNNFEAANRFGGTKPTSKQLFEWLMEYVNGYGAARYEEQQVDDIRMVDAVQILTIHQAKGLEWPNVFVPAMSAYRFPHSKSGSERDWLIPRHLFDAKKYEGDLASERKLLYVALTRARDTAVLSWFSSMKNRERDAGAFVKEVLDSGRVREISPSEPLVFPSVESGSEDDDLRTFSTGELVAFGRCPYMYRLRSVWGYQSGIVEMLGYGKALHHCLSESARKIQEGTHPVTAVAKTVDEHFSMPYVNAGKMEKIKKGAKSQLARFASDHEEDMRMIKNVEARLEFPTDSATVIGRADVILDDGGSIEVRDYKTSDAVIAPDEAAFQVQLYAIGFVHAGENVSRGSVAYLQDDTVKKVDVDSKALKTAENTALRYLQAINHDDYTAQPGKACIRCDFKSVCRWKGLEGVEGEGTQPESVPVPEASGRLETVPVAAVAQDREFVSACVALKLALEEENPAKAVQALKRMSPFLSGEKGRRAERLVKQLSLREQELGGVPDELRREAEGLY